MADSRRARAGKPGTKRRRAPDTTNAPATARAETQAPSAAAPAFQGPVTGPAGLSPKNAVAFQQILGNRAIGRAITIQRDPPDGGVATPTAADAGAPSGGVAETPRQQLDRALRDRTSAAIAGVSDFAPASDDEKISLIGALLGFAPLGATDGGTVRRIWQAWGSRLPLMAVQQSALWERCNTAGAALPESWLGGAAGHRTVSGTEQVGGTVYTISGGYDYRIMADSVVITVNMNFQPDAGVTVPTGTWFGYITSTWNRFDAVNLADPTQKKRIEFRPSGGGGHNIQVSAGTGRANAAHYYVGDTRAPQTIPHEFGHLIGLEDEYERDAPDFARVTGAPAPAGSGETETAKTIATGIHDGLMLPERLLEWHSTAVKRRQAAVQQVLAANHITPNYQAGQSALTHEVSTQYRELYGHEMSVDVMERIQPRLDVWHDDELQAWREQVLGTFQYTDTSIMGDMTDHSHPVAPRHVRAFAQIIQTFLGHGDWQPKER